MPAKNIKSIRIILALLLICATAAVLAFSHDEIVGTTRTVEYELPLENMDQFAQEFSSHLPLLVIQTDLNAVPDRYRPPAAVIWVFDNKAENRLTDSATAVLDTATVRHRGMSSLSFPQKPFAVKISEPVFLEPFEYAFLGFAPASEWVLHSPYADNSLLRNWFSYEIAASVLDWQPRGRPVQLFLQHGESTMLSYQGVYLLCEDITTGETRLDVGEFTLEASDTIDFKGGGYVFQIDRITRNYFFTLPGGAHVRYSYPTHNKITKQQNDALQKEIEFYFELLTGSGRFYGAAGETRDFQNYIDVDSFIDYFLAAELVGGNDLGTFSTYMHRPAGGKLVMGPIWDCDLSMGNFSLRDPSSFRFANMQTPLFIDFFEDEAVAIRFVNRWNELRGSIWSDDELFGLFDEMVEYLREPAAQNALRWPEKYDGETFIWPNKEPYVTSWEEEIERTRLWLECRLKWLDENVPRLAYETAAVIGNGETPPA